LFIKLTEAKLAQRRPHLSSQWTPNNLNQSIRIAGGVPPMMEFNIIKLAKETDIRPDVRAS
jgi:hypothetical protein